MFPTDHGFRRYPIAQADRRGARGVLLVGLFRFSDAKNHQQH